MRDIQPLLDRRNITLQPFQLETQSAFCAGRSGLINAPTGAGKTLALALPFFQLVEGMGTKLLWITPLRALAKDSLKSLQEIAADLGQTFTVGLRTGDTSPAERRKLEKNPPTILVTTPESLHVMLSQRQFHRTLYHLDCLVIDEWHELINTKRGVLVELAVAALKTANPEVKIWGLSATLADLDAAARVLIGTSREFTVIRARDEKEFQIVPLLPEKSGRFSWSGHLGTKLKDLVLEVIRNHRSVLVFTNTRGQTETWYRELIESAPELMGLMAVHHGSLDPGIRRWIEQSIHDGELRVVICTSSLDLGVDFEPVDAVVQVGSPKSVARFLQRAGRSGHSPGKTSILYFVPTNAWEVFDLGALRTGALNRIIESSRPLSKPLDVLVQYIVTRAAGEGFLSDALFTEVKDTAAYQDLTPEEWEWCLDFVSRGGSTLWGYDEYKRIILEDSKYIIKDKRTANRHRLSIGTIMSESMLSVKYLRGGYLGSIEERFISKLKPGEVFWLGGKKLKFSHLKDLTVYVRKTSDSGGTIPAWTGGRLSFSSEHAGELRRVVSDPEGRLLPAELRAVSDMIDLQRRWSHMPASGDLLIEKIESREGFHVFVYPIEGRVVHEGLALLFAMRLARRGPQTFSMAMNDYGLELHSDRPIEIEAAIAEGLFSTHDLVADLTSAVSVSELARRHFKEIARIAGLTFGGYPSKQKSSKQLLVSAALLYDVFAQHEPDNLLLRQSIAEVWSKNLELERTHSTLQRLQSDRPVITYPSRFSPLAFPLIVDRLRQKLSSEKLAVRIERMTSQLEKSAEIKKGKRDELTIRAGI